MPPVKTLDPTATAFIAGSGVGASGSPTATGTAPSSVCNLGLSHLYINDNHNTDPVIPGVPHNTPVIDSPKNPPAPKSSISVGHGWKSAFPATATNTYFDGQLNNSFNNNSSPVNTAPINFARTPNFLHSANHEDMKSRHRVKSPSVPEVLPSDEARREEKRGGDVFGSFEYPSSKAKLALKNLDKTFSPNKDAPKSSPKRSNQFDPFDEEEEEEPITVDWGTPQRATSVRLQTPSRSYSSTWSARNSTEPPSPLSAFSPSPNSTPDPYFSASVKCEESSFDPNHTYTDMGEGRNVYLPDLKPGTTDEILWKIGQKFGRVVSVKVENSNNMSPDAFDMFPDGPRRGIRTYAFVMFDIPQDAREFMKHLKSYNIVAQYGKETPHLKQKALEDPHSSNLYVAEIPFDTTEMEMRELFFPGIISSLRFLTDDQGNRRGTAMVRLQSRAQAEEAIRRLDLHTTLPGCTKPLQVRIADSENQKLLKKQTPRVADPIETARRASRTFASPSPPRAGHSTSISQDTDSQTLIQQLDAIKEELRRRESVGSISHQPSMSRLQRTASREQMSPASPSFDLSRRRYSEDTHDTLQSYLHHSPASRRPSLDTHISRGSDTPSFANRISRRPSLGIPMGRSDSSSPGWIKNASQDQLSGSASTSSSFGSLASFNDVKENPRYRIGSDFCRDPSREAF